MAVIPSLAQFRKTLQGTPMYGEAQGIYNTALKNGVNPAFVAGLAGAESSFGTAGYARGTKNPYGYGVYLNKRYPTYTAATDAMTKSLSGSLYKGAGLRSIEQVISRYSPSSDGNNVPKHISNIKSLGGRTGGDASQVFVDSQGALRVGNEVVSSTPEETATQAQTADTAARSIGAAVAGRQPGQSLFKTVFQGAIASQFAVKDFKGQTARNALMQDRTPGLVDVEGGGNTTPVEAAKQHLGVPYSWGGGTPSGPTRGFGRGANTVGFDCSSLVQYAWAKAGVKLPRVTYDQIKVGQAVPNISQAKPGDLLFPSRGHVQMYIGNGKVIEAPQTGGKVQIVGLRPNYIAIRRPG